MSFLTRELEFIEGKNYNRSDKNSTDQDGHRNYIALVLPVNDLAGRTATAEEGMWVPFLTVAARSCDWFEH